jgi:hypothetical protein
VKDLGVLRDSISVPNAVMAIIDKLLNKHNIRVNFVTEHGFEIFRMQGLWALFTVRVGCVSILVWPPEQSVAGVLVAETHL